MNLGIDFHDTFTYHPEFFITLISIWPGKKYIVTGTPEKERNLIIDKLRDFDIWSKIDGLLMGFNFDKSTMTSSHFQKMASHKLQMLLENNIQIYYDDNPFYASFLKDHEITVFQTILNKKYIAEYEKKDTYFSSHLQKEQFSYLKDLA